MIDPRRYARVMGYSHGQATGHSRRAAHRQATGGQATAMQGRFRHAADLASRAAPPAPCIAVQLLYMAGTCIARSSKLSAGFSSSAHSTDVYRALI